jgi:alpha-N-arabinofuranosidase
LSIDESNAGAKIKPAKGETLAASAVDSVNTFAAPNTVVPKPASASVKGGRLVQTVELKPVAVISLEP